MIKLGLDFDNTLINYDNLFYETALDLKYIPKEIPKTKIAVRKYLISINSEKKFTKLQGEVYGNRINDAIQAPGVFDALIKIKNKGIKLFIVSHKTKFPIIGPKYDLHQSALDWLQNNKFTKEDGLNIQRNEIFFELSKINKIKRIESIGCTHFVDDLIVILNEINPNIIRIHYNPSKKVFNSYSSIYSLDDWHNFKNLKIF